jgi:hypothetical protein
MVQSWSYCGELLTEYPAQSRYVVPVSIGVNVAF